MNGPNETVTVSTSVNDIEAMTITGWTITEKEFENIPDVLNAEKIVLISIRSKDRGSKIAESDQRKDLDNAEKYFRLSINLKPNMEQAYRNLFFIVELCLFSFETWAVLNSFRSTACPRSLCPFYIVTYYIKFVKTS